MVSLCTTVRATLRALVAAALPNRGRPRPLCAVRRRAGGDARGPEGPLGKPNEPVTRRATVQPGLAVRARRSVVGSAPGPSCGERSAVRTLRTERIPGHGLQGTGGRTNPLLPRPTRPRSHLAGPGCAKAIARPTRIAKDVRRRSTSEAVAHASVAPRTGRRRAVVTTVCRKKPDEDQPHYAVARTCSFTLFVGNGTIDRLAYRIPCHPHRPGATDDKIEAIGRVPAAVRDPTGADAWSGRCRCSASQAAPTPISSPAQPRRNPDAQADRP